MATKYDTEDFLEGIKALMISKLNTKITDLNTIKNDDIALPLIDDEAYAFMGLNERVMNFNPCIVYGVESLETISQLSGSALNITASVVLVLSESGVSDINKMMLRYSRALKELIEENYQSVGKGIKMTVSQFMPISFKLNTDDTVYKAIGINIDATIP